MSRARVLVVLFLIAASGFAAWELSRAVAAARRGGSPQDIVAALVPFRSYW